MRTNNRSRQWMGALLLGGLLVGLGLAQPANPPAKSSDPDEDKLVKFEMNGVPWEKVFDWLKDNYKFQFIGETKPPPGSVVISGPKDEVYNLGQIIDIINYGLQAKKHILLRRHKFMTLVPADDPIDAAWVQQIDLKQLAKKGNTEVVRVEVKLKSIVAEDFAPDLKKMLGPSGQVMVLRGANKLILQDMAGTLRSVIKTIHEIDIGAEVFSHECKYIRAADAAQMLKEFFGEPKPVEQPKFPKQDQPPPKIFKFNHAITFDAGTNTVHVNGPADIIGKAKTLLEKIDVEKNRSTDPFLKTYTVTGNAEFIANALKSPELLKHSNVKIFPINQTTIWVFAKLEDHVVIAKTLDVFQPVAATVEQVPVSTVSAANMAGYLKGIFADPKGGGMFGAAVGPFIDYDSDRNLIIVKGTPDQIKAVKNAIAVIDGPTQKGAQAGKVRIISLGTGSATSAAEVLADLLGKMKGIKVEVNIPGQSDKPAKPKEGLPKDKSGGGGGGGQGAKDKKDKEATIRITVLGNKLIVTSDDLQALDLVEQLVQLIQTATEGEFQVIKLEYADAINTARVLDEFFNGAKPSPGPGRQPGQPGGFPFPGGMGQEGGPGRQFGGMGQNGGPGRQFGGPGGLFGGLLGGPAATPRVERVRVVAYPATNSLLVKASLLDMRTVRRLVKDFLDTGVTDSKAVIKTWIIGPLQYSAANDVYYVLRDVYRESMNNNSRAALFAGGISPFGGNRQQMQNLDQHGNPMGVSLSIGVDDKTNSLIVACSENLYKDLDKLVDLLEETNSPYYFERVDGKKVRGPDGKDKLVMVKGPDGKLTPKIREQREVVRVEYVRGVDPNVLQDAIDRLQGRSTTSRTTTTGSGFPFSGTSGGFGASPFGGTPGGFGASPFGTSGFTPGMFGTGGFRPGFTGGNGSRFGGTTGGRFRPQRISQLGSPGGGRDFFVPAVTDDHPVLFDPKPERLQREARLALEASQALAEQARGDPYLPAADDPLYLISHEEAQPKDKDKEPKDKEPKDSYLRVPKLPVTVIAIPEIGGYVIRAFNKEDYEATKQIIEHLLRQAKEVEIATEIVQLRHADPNSVVNTLNQIYSRLIYSTTGTILAPPRTGLQQPPQVTPQPGVPGAQPPTPAPQAPAAAAAAQPAGPVMLIPLPRQNAIWVAAPRTLLKKAPKKDEPNILRDINNLDVPNLPGSQIRPFRLKKASALIVATRITQFFDDRYPGQNRAMHQIRVTYDEASNTIFVQAAPADMTDIEAIIRQMDGPEGSQKLNDMRVVPLKNAYADELALILTQAISAGALLPSTGTGAALPGLGGAGQLGGLGGQLGGLGGQLGGPGGQLGGLGGQLGGLGGQLGQQRLGAAISSVRFFSNRRDGIKGLEASPLDDVHITSYAPINSLIIQASEKNMELILALVRELDVPPAVRAEINIFALKRADAAQLATSLQQLFLGGGAGARPGAAGPGGIPGGIPGATTGLPGALGQAGLGQAGVRPLQLTLGPVTPEGVPIIDLRVTIDERTNSLIVAGSRNDLDVIEAIISRLEDSGVEERKNVAYRLVNAQAADVAATLNDFITKYKAPYSSTGQLTAYQELQRDVIIVPEPISNTLLVSATPYYFKQIVDLIEKLDYLPPQVMIQVLVAEVNLNNAEEFGVEWGYQSPVLFNRSLGAGQTVSNTTPGGFNFINASSVAQPLGQQTVVDPGVVGFQPLSNLGLGRISPRGNIGGLVFSASSDTVNVLVRALRQQGRLDVLSRPMIQTLDNQRATINVGQQVPFISGAAVITAGVAAQPPIDYKDVGVNLTVTPKINPDGTVLMRVIPVVNSLSDSFLSLAGFNAPIFNNQALETTVTAKDAETIVLGGLITKKLSLAENKVPIFGDLPILGAAFRFRSQVHERRELLIILTPHVIRCRADAERLAADEALRMNWRYPEVQRVHGMPGLDMFPAMGPPILQAPLDHMPGDHLLLAPKIMPPPQTSQTAAPMMPEARSAERGAPNQPIMVPVSTGQPLPGMMPAPVHQSVIPVSHYQPMPQPQSMQAPYMQPVPLPLPQPQPMQGPYSVPQQGQPLAQPQHLQGSYPVPQPSSPLPQPQHLQGAYSFPQPTQPQPMQAPYIPAAQPLPPRSFPQSVSQGRESGPWVLPR